MTALHLYLLALSTQHTGQVSKPRQTGEICQVRRLEGKGSNPLQRASRPAAKRPGFATCSIYTQTSFYVSDVLLGWGRTDPSARVLVTARKTTEAIHPQPQRVLALGGGKG